MHEKRFLNNLLLVLVGDDAPEETPDDELVSERLMNDFSIKSLFVLYIRK